MTTDPAKNPVPSRYEVRDMGLVRRARGDDEDDEQFKPLEWGLIRRLFAYTAPVKRKLVALLVLTFVRSAQLPALVWASATSSWQPTTRAGATSRRGLRIWSNSSTSMMTASTFPRSHSYGPRQTKPGRPLRTCSRTSSPKAS